ncbi:hypothetical protein PROVALCAL_03592 [Providencia alcalifaciens DSM 30120]|uniref:Uncharacterized protein n=1 Tax=Providencia alcalifaciens DSM 30120 TaxID=520999 RepID=B6XJN3_9GAMM|nr:hypothetical protein PROVALCAL_03592 [Providencia alcalifaciens DSM 30120]
MEAVIAKKPNKVSCFAAGAAVDVAMLILLSYVSEISRRMNGYADWIND